MVAVDGELKPFVVADLRRRWRGMAAFEQLFSHGSKRRRDPGSLAALGFVGSDEMIVEVVGEAQLLMRLCSSAALDLLEDRLLKSIGSGSEDGEDDSNDGLGGI